MTTRKKTVSRDQSLSIAIEIKHAGREMIFRARVPKASKRMLQDIVQNLASGVAAARSMPPTPLSPEMEEYIRTGQWPESSKPETH